MSRRTEFMFLIVLGVLTTVYALSDPVDRGVHPHAEYYELNFPEEKVIKAIKELKESDTTFEVPTQQWLVIEDGKANDSTIWYKFFFYDKEKNRILFTWTKPHGQMRTTFAFVAINDSNDTANWKMVNQDFGFFENKKLKDRFEEMILKKVNKNVSNGK